MAGAAPRAAAVLTLLAPLVLLRSLLPGAGRTNDEPACCAHHRSLLVSPKCSRRHTRHAAYAAVAMLKTVNPVHWLLMRRVLMPPTVRHCRWTLTGHAARATPLPARASKCAHRRVLKWTDLCVCTLGTRQPANGLPQMLQVGITTALAGRSAFSDSRSCH